MHETQTIQKLTLKLSIMTFQCTIYKVKIVTPHLLKMRREMLGSRRS